MKTMRLLIIVVFFSLLLSACETTGNFGGFGSGSYYNGSYYDPAGTLGGLAQQAVTPGMVRGGALGALVGVATRNNVGRTAAIGALAGAGFEMLSQYGQPPRQLAPYPAGASSNPGLEAAYNEGLAQGQRDRQYRDEQIAREAGRAAGYGYR